MSDLQVESRTQRLDRALTELLAQTPEIEAAAVVSFDGLPMAAALPPSMDEDRVAAMSAALLSLGERAAQGLGRGELSQVYIEGDNGTVFLISCDDEAVLVAVAAHGAKAGMMLYEVRRTAKTIGAALSTEEPAAPVAPAAPVEQPAAPEPLLSVVSAVSSVSDVPASPVPHYELPTYDAPRYDAPTYDTPSYANQTDTAWSSSYAPSGSSLEPTKTWS